MNRKRKPHLTLVAIALVMSSGVHGEEPQNEARRDAQSPEPGVTSEALAAMGSTGPDSALESANSATAGHDDSAPAVMDEIVLDSTQVTGNQELPKVLYIVPWQKTAAGELLVRPDDSLEDDVLDPIDRPEFMRQVDIYGDLFGEADP